MFRNLLTPKFNGDGTVTLSGPCMMTMKEYSVTVPEVGYRQWATGNALIQSALPDVSKEDREFLISGTSPEGWEMMFGSEDEEEDSDDDLHNDDVFEDEGDFNTHRSIIRGR
jgi:hypothetical protein